MVDLRSDFQSGRIIDLDLQVPLLARRALRRFSEITDARDICIAGGFVRGLYMQQFLGLTPEMNDVDIFADLPHEKFAAVKDRLETEFGAPVRYHFGQFEKEEDPRGLIEFALPEPLRAGCAGVESIQLNFGFSHPWANAFNYITRANVGMNQIAVHPDGKVLASQAFIDDMTNKTMTMNSDRHWTSHDWTRTTRSLERMQAERPEFQGWKTILTPRPYAPVTGSFWQNQNAPAPLN